MAKKQAAPAKKPPIVHRTPAGTFKKPPASQKSAGQRGGKKGCAG